jgi:MYXO-CTERM domain-containing protein
VVAADTSGDDPGDDGTPVPWLVGGAIVALAAGVARRARSRTWHRAGREVLPVSLPAAATSGPGRDRDRATEPADGVGDAVGTRTRVRL